MKLHKLWKTGEAGLSLQQCHPNSARSLVIARKTGCNPHCFVVFFVLLATPQTGVNGQGI